MFPNIFKICWNYFVPNIIQICFLNVFPNPSNRDLFIESKDPIELLEIKDLSGRVVFEMAPQKSKVHIQTSQLKKSFYNLTVL